MARRKMKTRVRSAVTTSVKSKVGLVQPRTVKSRFKADVKQLTVNQIEFLKASKNLERRVKRYAKNIGLALSPDDILGMIPDMPKRVTKQYISKLIATSAKELIELWMPELKLADPIVEKVVETVVEQAVEKTGGKVEPSEGEDKSQASDYPTLGIMERVIDWIQYKMPDEAFIFSKKEGYIRIDLSEHKSYLINVVKEHYADADGGDSYSQWLLDNEAELINCIDSIVVTSNQEDMNLFIYRIYNIITMNTTTPYGESIVENLNNLMNETV